MLTDPIADFLTRIRNGAMAHHPWVDVPSSRMKRQLSRILKKEGFISEYKNVRSGPQGFIRVYLKYDNNNQPVIIGLKRVSRPGLRIYCGVDKLPRVRNGYGIAIMSTPAGVITNREARQKNVGGEVLCHVW